MNLLAALTLLAVSASGFVRDDVGVLEAKLRADGGVVEMISPHFAEAQRHWRLALPAAVAAPKACASLLLVGAMGLSFHVQSEDSAPSLDARSLRGVAVVSRCGAALPTVFRVQVNAGRGTIEARMVWTDAELADEDVALESRLPPDAARDHSPAFEAVSAPPRVVVERLAGHRVARLDADSFGRATLEESWPAGCRRLLVRAEHENDSADLDVMVDGPGGARWLEDRGPAAVVDRVLCTPELRPATVRIVDASPLAALRVEEVRLADFPALDSVRSPVYAARFASVLHAAKLVPSPAPALYFHGTGSPARVAVAAEDHRCEAYIVTFVEGKKSARAFLQDGPDVVPFLRVGDSGGLAVARCSETREAKMVVIEAASPWSLATFDLGQMR